MFCAMRRSLSLLLVPALCFLCISNAHGQRTVYGQRFITAGPVCSFTSVGGLAGFGAYTYDGYWNAGLRVVNRARYESNTGEVVSFLRCDGSFARYHRLVSTSDRRLNVYGGGDVFIGWEFMDPFQMVDQSVRVAVKSAGYHDTRFVYGLSALAEAEYYINDIFGLVLGFRMPVAFGTDLSNIGAEVSLAVRFWL